MMNRKKLFSIMLAAGVLSACYDTRLASLKLDLPDNGQTLEEDFPIGKYIGYADNVEPLNSITAVDVNGPALSVLQTGVSLGVVDTTTQSLDYTAAVSVPDAHLQALDFDQSDEAVWVVNGDDQLVQNAPDGTPLNYWIAPFESELTEVAIDEAQQIVWAYDNKGHALLKFDIETEQWVYIQLFGEVIIKGIAINDEQVILLGEQDTQHALIALEAKNGAFTVVDGWNITGFPQGTEFNDVSFAPDGRALVSTSSPEDNLFLIVDKNRLSGEGPIADEASLALVRTIALPPSIKQPSGIYSPDGNQWLINTDQAEIILLDSDFALTTQTTLAFETVDCNQGCTEGITGSIASALVITDAGVVGKFDADPNGYSLTQEYTLDFRNQEGELFDYAGIGYDALTQQYYLISDSNDADAVDELFVLDSDFKLVSRHAITYPGETDGSINEYDAQGVQFYQGSVYFVSQAFTKFVKMNLSGGIEAVYDIDATDIAEPSDFAINNDLIYMIGDHEDDQPVPPISVYQLPN